MNKEKNTTEEKIEIDMLDPVVRSEVVTVLISPNQKKLIRVIKAELEAFEEWREGKANFETEEKAEEYAKAFLDAHSDVAYSYGINKEDNAEWPFEVYFVFDFPEDFFDGYMNKGHTKYVEVVECSSY